MWKRSKCETDAGEVLGLFTTHLSFLGIPLVRKTFSMRKAFFPLSSQLSSTRSHLLKVLLPLYCLTGIYPLAQIPKDKHKTIAPSNSVRYILQFNSNLIFLELASDPVGSELSPIRFPPSQIPFVNRRLSPIYLTDLLLTAVNQVPLLALWTCCSC